MTARPTPRQRAVSRALARAIGTSRIRTGRAEVVLTYDDGPDPEQTPGVLAALAEGGAQATFFVLLGRARRHADLVRTMVAAGHEIALHGPDHRPATRVAAAEHLPRTSAAKAELQAIAGVPVGLIRPPYGLQTIASARAARVNGLETVLWSRAADDWIDVPHEQRMRSALDGVRAGDVLLVHDGHAGVADGADDGPAPELDRARLAADLLAGLAERGLAARSLIAARRR